jgi:hypothetical protein
LCLLVAVAPLPRVQVVANSLVSDLENFQWNGEATSLAQEFGVSEGTDYSTLSELCARRLIKKVYARTYCIVRCRERDESGEEKV